MECKGSMADMFTVLFNTYQGYANLMLHGSSEYILSKEGVTQGNPLSMLLYAMAVLPHIQALIDHENVTRTGILMTLLVLLGCQDCVSGLMCCLS